MNTEIELLTQLQDNLVSFLDELIQSFPKEGDFYIFRIFVKDSIPIADIMNYIVKELCPLQDFVKRRDESFFIDHNILFEKFDEQKASKVNYFKRMWKSNELDKTDKEAIWNWFDTFIYLGNKYYNFKKVNNK